VHAVTSPAHVSLARFIPAVAGWVDGALLWRRRHAEGAAAIFTVIATSRLRRIEPQRYLEELMRVLPYWRRDRYIEGLRIVYND